MGDEIQWWDDVDSPAFAAQIITTQGLHGKRKSKLTAQMIEFLEERDLTVPRRLHREDGFHPSSLGSRFCARLETFKRLLPRAFDDKRFSGNLQLRFEMGKAGHGHWQTNLYGKMRILRGIWECTRCTRRVYDAYMPEHPCPKCNWPVNPATGGKAPRSSRSKRCDAVCIWPGGFDTQERDCAACERGGNWTFKETRIEIPELEIVGHYDGIIFYEGLDRVLEFKTRDPKLFPVQEPDEDHVIQCNIYMWAEEIDHGLIVYLNKGTGETVEFEIEPDPTVRQLIETRINYVRQYVAEKTLPNGVCGSPKSFDAKICPYSDCCFLGYDKLEEVVAWIKEREDYEAVREEDDAMYQAAVES